MKAELKARLEHWSVISIATGFFSGFFPVAPGTAGSLVGVAFVWLFRDTAIFFQVVLCLFLAGIGVWASQKAGQHFKVADSSHIVIDEIVGMMLTMIGIPVTRYWLVIGFLLFRFFDIMKFPPANLADQKLKNGWGVMLDDIIAGIFANVLLRLMLRSAV
jgi:phosphatidylglycerophosphatase A